MILATIFTFVVEKSEERCIFTKNGLTTYYL